MILGAIGHVLSLKCTMYLVKESSGIGRGHGRSKAAGTIRKQEQQIKDLKDRIATLESENKALQEEQKQAAVDASKSQTEQKQQVKELKDRIQALESENKALRESQEPKTKEASKPKTERKAKAPEKVSSNLKPGPELDRTFHSAWQEIHKTWEFPRVSDLRRKVNLPREVFDAEIRRLRDSMTVQLMQADGRRYTKEELADCFRDENGYIMGIIDWI